jgi:hypothetical protein
MVIIEHLGGAAAFFGGKENPQHRSFGKILVTVGRAIACVGWVVGGNVQNAVVVGVVSLVITAVALALPSSKKAAGLGEAGDRARSKSPRAKRE